MGVVNRLTREMGEHGDRAAVVVYLYAQMGRVRQDAKPEKTDGGSRAGRKEMPEAGIRTVDGDVVLAGVFS